MWGNSRDIIRQCIPWMNLPDESYILSEHTYRHERPGWVLGCKRCPRQEDVYTWSNLCARRLISKFSLPLRRNLCFVTCFQFCDRVSCLANTYAQSRTVCTCLRPEHRLESRNVLAHCISISVESLMLVTNTTCFNWSAFRSQEP